MAGAGRVVVSAGDEPAGASVGPVYLARPTRSVEGRLAPRRRGVVCLLATSLSDASVGPA